MNDPLMNLSDTVFVLMARLAVSAGAARAWRAKTVLCADVGGLRNGVRGKSQMVQAATEDGACEAGA